MPVRSSVREVMPTSSALERCSGQLIVVALVILALIGCSRQTEKVTAGPAVDQAQITATPVGDQTEANFTLFVSNQSFEKSPMHITVAIDGHRVVAADFDVGTQHSFFRFPLKVTPGTRKLVARAGDGTLTEELFELPTVGERWGVLMYWASSEPSLPDRASPSPPSLAWELDDEEPHFF